VQHANAFEFQGESIGLPRLLEMALPHPGATHILWTHREKGQVIRSRIEWAQCGQIQIWDGDILEVGAERLSRQVRVTLTGEFEGDGTLVLEKSCTLQDLFKRGLLRAAPTGNPGALQLFRKSVAQQQKDMIEKSLSQLERQMMFSGPINSEEARIRVEEAKIFKEFIARAREVEPRGLVVMDGDRSYAETFLEDGDILHIPAKAHTIVVSGSVRLPMTFAYDERKTATDYIHLAGGLTREADPHGILIIRPNGESRMLEGSGPVGCSSRRRGREIAPRTVFSRDRTTLSPGDTIMILPKITTSSILLAQSVADILYKIAIVTRTVLKW